MLIVEPANHGKTIRRFGQPFTESPGNRMNLNETKLSVVMASLAGETIVRTVNSINSGTVIPDEIIVVVPRKYADKIPNNPFNNLRYEIVEFQGQVAQRLHGFRIAKNEFVMQVDDDISFEEHCIENLLNVIKRLGPGSAVGPSLCFDDDKAPVYLETSATYNLKAFLLSGAKWGQKRMGTINKIGSSHGYDESKLTDEYVKIEWLAGGCVIHYRSSLVMENYFPFPGKAYGEDLIHSILLLKSGIKLYNVRNATCYISRPNFEKPGNYSIYLQYQSRCYLNRLRGISNFRVHIWLIVKMSMKYLRDIFNASR